MHNKQGDISKLAIQNKQEINNARGEAGNLFKLSENQKQKDINDAQSMTNTLVKLSEIETSLAQHEAGIRVKNAEKKPYQRNRQHAKLSMTSNLVLQQY